jgi:hypothetical protein
VQNKLTKAIDSWFAARQDDGEFVYERRPFTVIGRTKPAAPIIYATKVSQSVRAIYDSGDCAEFGLIGGYGLPIAADLLWIRKIVANRRFYFLGDMDPVDLLVFAWLRESLRPQRVKHLGVNDQYLKDLKVRLPGSFTLKLSESEQESRKLLAVAFPRLRKTLGDHCADLLGQGRKIELEAVVSALGTPKPILRPAIHKKK